MHYLLNLMTQQHFFRVPLRCPAQTAGIFSNWRISQQCGSRKWCFLSIFFSNFSVVSAQNFNKCSECHLSVTSVVQVVQSVLLVPTTSTKLVRKAPTSTFWSKHCRIITKMETQKIRHQCFASFVECLICLDLVLTCFDTVNNPVYC